MRVRKHFRTSSSTIDYILADFNFNRISDKNIYFRYCVNKRMELLHSNYDSKLDRILSYIILHCDYDNMPVESLAKIALSLAKVTNVLAKGFISVISE